MAVCIIYVVWECTRKCVSYIDGVLHARDMACVRVRSFHRTDSFPSAKMCCVSIGRIRYSTIKRMNENYYECRNRRSINVPHQLCRLCSIERTENQMREFWNRARLLLLAHSFILSGTRHNTHVSERTSTCIRVLKRVYLREPHGWLTRFTHTIGWNIQQ